MLYSIGGKLARVQLASLSLLLIVSALAIWSLGLLSHSVITLYDETEEQFQSVSEAADLLAENRIAESYVVLGNIKTGRSLIDKRNLEFDRELRSLGKLTQGTELAADVGRLAKAWEHYRGEQKRLVRTAVAGDGRGALQLFRGGMEREFATVDALTDNLVAKIGSIAESRELTAEGVARRATSAVMVLVLIGVVISMWLLIFVRRRITGPLGEITESLTELAAGNLSVQVCGGGRRDEVGALVKALEVFRVNAMDLQQAHLDTQEAQAHAEALARHDPLTGLPNRRVFVEAAQRLAEKATPTALLMIDLDRFKPVNDAFGHAAGDRVLCTVAERIAQLRSDYMVARLGGDEFAALVPLQGGADAAVQACGLIQQIINRPIEIDDKMISVGCSIGVALCPSDGSEASTLLRAADLAMYEAKSDRKGSYRFFETEMQAELERRAQFDAEMHKAIAEGDIQPYYQPLVDIDGHGIVGFEILSRWVHPTRGTIMPDEFIQAAEERGLLPDLTYSLLDQACEDAQAWPDNIRLSINMSPGQLRDNFLAARMLAILQRWNVHPSRIEVEVTENALVSDLEATKHVLTSLQNLVMTVALDDFGTGYSSLYHLRELRFDKIKVDKSFIHSLGQGQEKAKIVRAMIGLGKSLGLSTTAEGIEDPEQLSRLVAWGCDYGQGFLFGRAMDANATTDFLQRQQERPSAAAVA